MHADNDTGRRCAAATLPAHPGKPDGSRCREWDGRAPGWAAHGTPLCETELRVAERDARSLVYDYVDLEQMIPRPLSQALTGQPAGKPGPPMPIAGAPEALQAEIVHVLTTWEVEVRAAAGLPELPQHGPNAPWHTTITKRPAPARVRPRTAVSRAVAVLAPRVEALARLAAATVYPTGCEDDPADVCGWEAVLALSRLHARARAMLGRTRRTLDIPGTCSTCQRDELRRDEPREQGDNPPVYCEHCATVWSYEDYERYVTMLVWPGRSAA